MTKCQERDEARAAEAAYADLAYVAFLAVATCPSWFCLRVFLVLFAWPSWLCLSYVFVVGFTA
ncbi:hypothetical protein V1506DRAFT_550064 [Lipomyces tetrasporus]